MVTWADEAVRMYTDRAFGFLTAQDVRALIDRIDERPELARKLEKLDRGLQRQELRMLALRLLEARKATLSPVSTGAERAEVA